MRAGFRIHGRVQGVGFRFFVCQEARALGLAGWVRNDPDGTVVGEAVGPFSRLEALRDRLGGGPGFGRVDQLEWGCLEGEEGMPATFEVRG